jgi:hypothetical protein
MTRTNALKCLLDAFKAMELRKRCANFFSARTFRQILERAREITSQAQLHDTAL